MTAARLKLIYNSYVEAAGRRRRRYRGIIEPSHSVLEFRSLRNLRNAAGTRCLWRGFEIAPWIGVRNLPAATFANPRVTVQVPLSIHLRTTTSSSKNACRHAATVVVGLRAPSRVCIL